MELSQPILLIEKEHRVLSIGEVGAIVDHDSGPSVDDLPTGSIVLSKVKVVELIIANIGMGNVYRRLSSSMSTKTVLRTQLAPKGRSCIV